MAKPVLRALDFGGARRITNLAPGAAAGEPVVFEQMNAALEGLAWKDDVVAASTANINLASPGAAIDGVTMANGDRFLAKSQTTQSQNGIYVWNGAATPATRALDSSTFVELESAVVTVSEGTSNAGTTWRQTQVNGTIDSSNVVWTAFGTGASAASESTAGIAEIATQVETDTGTDDTRFVTPLKLATYSGGKKKFAATVGDGSATSIAVTHNLGTKDLIVQVQETGGTFRQVDCEIQFTTTNAVTLLFDSAPASNSYRVVILG